MSQSPKWLQGLVKWFPAGVSGGATAHFAINQQWVAAISTSSLTLLFSLWANYSEGLTETLNKGAKERGTRTGEFLLKQFDDLVSTLIWVRSGFQGQYLRSVQASCSELKIEGFKIGLPVLALEDVFVPLKVATSIPGQMSGAMVQNTGNVESKEIWGFLRQGNKTSTYRRIAILAPPGYGKTTLLQHLALTYARKTHRKQKVPDRIPVLIYLRNVRKQLASQKPPTLAELMTEWVTQPDGKNLKPPPNWFESQLKVGHCLIMLDGLDEVADAIERHQVSCWVNQQLKRYRQTTNTFILTSRPHGYQSNILEDVGIVLEVKPFTLEQVKQFIQSWYLQTEIRTRMGQDDPYVRGLAKENADNLMNAIIRKPAIQQMASNPLLVTMIATVHYCGDALPGRRVELYQKICDVLLGARQIAKKIEAPLTKEQNKSVLQDLALKLMLQELRSFTLAEGKVLIQDQLKTVSDKLSPEDFLDQIKEVSGLLVEQQVGIYEFAHLSLQEYLAAAQIEKLQQEEILTRNFQNPWWAETIRLYAAQGDATNLIQTALNLSKKTLQALSLAYDCLEEGLTCKAGVRKQLETILEAGLESDDAALARMAATVKLSRRLNQLLEIDEFRAIDLDYITRAEYDLACPEFTLSRAKEPITNIQFRDAVKFCNWLRTNAPKLQRTQQEELYHYRLPVLKETELYPEQEHPSQGSGLRIVRARLPETLASLWNQIESDTLFSNRYEYLFHCLMNDRWKEADQETYEVMCQIIGKSGGRWNVEDIQNFPCEDLCILNQLWVQFSGGRFGFSVQRDIWVAVGGKLDGQYNEATWSKFADRVEWRKAGKYVIYSDYSDLTFASGHLPCAGWFVFLVDLYSSLASRTAKCNL